MLKSWKISLSEIETALRSGDVEAARNQLRSMSNSRIPRRAAAPFSSLAGRAGMPDLGLRALGRYVRPSHRLPATPTPDEKTEYAWCLMALGAVGEARALLAEVDGEIVPRAYLYQAFACAFEWQYRDSIAPLKRYLARPEISGYDRLVARVNLASALVFERETYKAEAMLRELLHETSLRRYTLLTANVLELSAEHFILLKEWSEAERCLGKARELLGGSDLVYEQLVEKWSSILSLMRGNSEDISEFSSLARHRGQWEWARDCDRFRVLKARDGNLAAHLYFGTPLPAYRDRVLSELEGKLALPDRYDWRLDGGGGPCPVLDVYSGEWRSADGKVLCRMKTGLGVHLVLLHLASDFYRPLRKATLHALLHPEVSYNRDSSPARVHGAIQCARRWLAENKIPLAIDAVDGAYRLSARAPMAIRICRKERLGKTSVCEIDRLRSCWPSTFFATRDAVQQLGVPRRSIQRILRRAVGEGVLERFSAKGHSKYRFRSQAA